MTKTQKTGWKVIKSVSRRSAIMRGRNSQLAVFRTQEAAKNFLSVHDTSESPLIVVECLYVVCKTSRRMYTLADTLPLSWHPEGTALASSVLCLE